MSICYRHGSFSTVVCPSCANAQYEASTGGPGWKTEAESKVRRATELLNAGLTPDAERLLVDALASDPGNLRGHVYLATCRIMAGDHDGYAEHLVKAMQLLGSSGNNDSASYAELLRAIGRCEPAERTRIAAAAEIGDRKIETFLTEHSGDVRPDVIYAAIEIRQDGPGLRFVKYIEPKWLSAGVVKTALENDCPKIAQFAALNMVIAGGEQKDAPMWLQGALCLWEVKHATGEGAADGNLELLEDWPVENVAALFELFAANSAAMRQSFSDETWKSFREQFSMLYAGWRERIYAHLNGIASQQAAKPKRYGWATGCALYLIAAVVFSLLLALVGVSQDTAPKIGAVFGVIAAIILIILMNQRERQKVIDAAMAPYVAQQRQVEAALV
jgi:uncharacterized membrane protein YeaQ/YmgE (transglycosylase-associated protein family)